MPIAYIRGRLIQAAAHGYSGLLKIRIGRTRLIYIPNILLIRPTFFWIVPASLSLRPAAAMWRLFVM
jgi:hypothetical protein